MNAMKHGAYGTLSGAVRRGPLAEDPEAIADLVGSLVDSLDPPDDLFAQRLARDLAWAMVKEDRVKRFEAELLTDPGDTPNTDGSKAMLFRFHAQGHRAAGHSLRRLADGATISRDEIVNVLGTVAFAPQINEDAWSELADDTPAEVYLELLRDLLERRFDCIESAAELADARARECTAHADEENDAIRPEVVRNLLRSDLLARLDRAGAHASREFDGKLRRYRERVAELRAAERTDAFEEDDLTFLPLMRNEPTD